MSQPERMEIRRPASLRPSQLGYHVVEVEGRERIEPVNEAVQVVFERVLWRFRQR